MENNTGKPVEPEEKKTNINDDYNPLDEIVIDKPYTSSNINATAEERTKPIGEATFAAPPFTKPTPKPEEKKREPINPEMRSLPKKETQEAAAHMALLIMQGYEWAHTFANKGLQVSEKKLNKLQAEGEINLNAMIDYDYGKKTSAGEFFKEYNEQAINALTVSQEFKDEVTPVLERVLAKRGIGMTDEQLLMFMFGKDIASKAVMFAQLKGQLNYMIQSIKQATTSQYAQPAPHTPPYTPPPPPEPPKEPEMKETPKQTQPAVKPDVVVMPKKRR